MTQGTQVTTFLKLKQKESKLRKQADEIKSQANDLMKEIIVGMEAEKINRVEVKMGSVGLKSEPVFSAKDWNKVWQYIFRKKDKNLLQKRLGQAHLKELLEDGVKIPGIEKMTKKTLTVGYKKSV